MLFSLFSHILKSSPTAKSVWIHRKKQEGMSRMRCILFSFPYILLAQELVAMVSSTLVLTQPGASIKLTFACFIWQLLVQDSNIAGNVFIHCHNSSSISVHIYICFRFQFYTLPVFQTLLHMVYADNWQNNAYSLISIVEPYVPFCIKCRAKGSMVGLSLKAQAGT